MTLSIAIVAGLILAGGCTATQIIENITPQEASRLIQDHQNDPDFAILDVRTPSEFAEGHIENATNLDFYSDTFADDLNLLDKDKAYLIYCRSGVRSGDALEMMAEFNFREVYNISDGIIAWEKAGLPTVK
jgi:rhodanese-related sulfurtransferase